MDGILLVHGTAPGWESRGAACDALGVSELILLPVEFHALSTEQHKVQTGVLNPHLRETSHVGVGSPVMLFHKKKKK